MIKARLKKRLDQCFVEGVDQGLWTGAAEGLYVREYYYNHDIASSLKDEVNDSLWRHFHARI